MYKRTIEALRGKEEKDESDARMKRLENSIASIDAQINEYIRKVEGLKKVTKVQDKVIEKDINEDLLGGVSSFKKETEEIRSQFKELQKRERQREVSYKRQQAYLF
jgi:seryl-tRNA synthetase